MDYKYFFDLCLQYSDNLFLIVSNDFLILDINPSAETLLGWKKKDVIGQNIHDLFTKTSTQSFIDKSDRVTKNSCTTYSIHPDQSFKIIWDILPMNHNKQPSDIILVIGKNITLSDDQLENLQLENILNYSPGLFYWKDKNSVYQGCNDEFARVAGLESRIEVKGKTDFDLVWKDRAELYVAIDKKVIDSGIASLNHEEMIAISSKDKLMTAITNKVPLRNSKGEVIGLLGITIDITHQKKVERDLHMAKEAAEAANRVKTEFISNMSHDIRTPLTGVVGMSKMLEDSVTSPDHKQYAHWLGESGDQLLHMLNGILDVVSSDRTNENDLCEESFDIKQMIQDIVELERPSIIVKGIELITHVDEAIPTYLLSDHIKLHRILLNLLGNAIKFTDTGYVEIKVTLLKQSGDDLLLQFQVSDTGIGISYELQHQVFDQFFRVMPSYEGIYTGHGLGLHIAQSYAHLLGSDIKLKSEPGVGTTFYFDVALKIGEKIVDQSEIEGSQMMKKGDMFSSSPGMVVKTRYDISDIPVNAPLLLLIEDNKIALLMLENLVTQSGCRFMSAMDGETALHLAKSEPFDLIVTDLGLPKLSGIELTRSIRAFEIAEHKKSVPIFGLTAHADLKIKSECLEAGMNQVLIKPMTPTLLEEIKLNYFSSLSKSDDTEKVSSTDSVPTNLGPGLPETEEALFELEPFPLLNAAHALQRIGNDISLLKSILSAMVEQELPHDLQELYELHVQGDWDNIVKLAHRMKGGLVYCGTDKLVLACQYLERYRKAGFVQKQEALYNQLCEVAKHTIVFVKEWLKIK